MSGKLLMIVNDPGFFLSHRLPIAIRAKKSGYSVWVATGPGEGVEQIIDSGLEWIPIPLTRSGRNPVRELYALTSILSLLRKIKPDLLHLVTIKPVLYGGIAARFASVQGTVAAISGLGHVFSATGFKATLVRGFISRCYRCALAGKKVRVIFQNPHDRDILVRARAVEPSATRMIRGSGVELNRYRFEPENPNEPTIVCFAARLLKDKGVVEFVEAARILRSRGLPINFWLVGEPDPDNPTSITHRDLNDWKSEGVVEVLGYRTDIADIFVAAHIVTLPSYYGEGLPKVLMEAAACGRPVITTDHPGCRDAIEADVSGLLVPVRDATALADAIESLASNSQMRQAMGRAGRALAEREFAIEKIVDRHMAIYKELDGDE